MKSNYELVLEIIESYDDESILSDFKNEKLVLKKPPLIRDGFILFQTTIEIILSY